MKEVARFHGRVNRLCTVPSRSYVTLKNLATNETVDTDAVTEKLLEAGIDHEGCQFEVIINESLEGKVTAEMHKVDPKPVSPERTDEIKAAFDGRWNNLENIDRIGTETEESGPERIKRLEAKILELQRLLQKREQ